VLKRRVPHHRLRSSLTIFFVIGGDLFHNGLGVFHVLRSGDSEGKNRATAATATLDSWE